MGLRADARPLWVMGDIVTSIRYDGVMEQTSERISRKKAARAAWLRDLRRLWLLVPGVVAFVLTMLARANPDACEELFSRGAYPWISSVWGYLPSLVGFSMAQWVVIVAVILVICMIVHYIMRIITRRGERLRYLYRLITSALGIISIAFFLYAMLCGLNYYRHTFAQNEGFEVRESTAQELTDLCNDLATELNVARADIVELLVDMIRAVARGHAGHFQLVVGVSFSRHRADEHMAVDGNQLAAVLIQNGAGGRER